MTSRRQHLTTDPRPKYLHPLSLVGEGCHANKAQASSYNESPENNKGKTKDKETPRSHPTGTPGWKAAPNSTQEFSQCCGVR